MSAAAVIAIVIAAIVVLFLLAWAFSRMRERRSEQLRARAGEERFERRARELRAVHAERARELDPDVDDADAEARDRDGVPDRVETDGREGLRDRDRV